MIVATRTGDGPLNPFTRKFTKTSSKLETILSTSQPLDRRGGLMDW